MNKWLDTLLTMPDALQQIERNSFRAATSRGMRNFEWKPRLEFYACRVRANCVAVDSLGTRSLACEPRAASGRALEAEICRVSRREHGNTIFSSVGLASGGIEAERNIPLVVRSPGTFLFYISTAIPRYRQQIHRVSRGPEESSGQRTRATVVKIFDKRINENVRSARNEYYQHN